MIKLDDIKRVKRDKTIYILPGRRTTECAKHAAEVLVEINTLVYPCGTGENPGCKRNV